MSQVHDKEVHFYDSDAENAKEWLRKGLTGEGFRLLLERAKDKGKVKFYNHKEDKFVLEYEKGEEGKDKKDSFKVKMYY